MRNLLYILIAAFLISSCSEPTNTSQALNTKAALPATFNFKKLCPLVISSSINTTKGTMSTLYGNQQAYVSELTKDRKPDNGEILALITWKQQEDPHWFGGRIPGELLSVEVIKTPATGNAAFSYQRFEGTDLHLIPDTTDNNLRIQNLIARQPSVMP